MDRETYIVWADYFKVIMFCKKTICKKAKFYKVLVHGIKKLIQPLIPTLLCICK